MTEATIEPEVEAEPNYELERTDCLIREKLEHIVGHGKVTPKLLDLYWKAKWALDRQNGGQLSPESLAILCALSGAVEYSRFQVPLNRGY